MRRTARGLISRTRKNFGAVRPRKSLASRTRSPQAPIRATGLLRSAAMLRALVVVGLLVVAATCTAPPSDAEIAAATLYFPPEYRCIDEERFCFSVAERERALQAYRQDGADTLFELVIDAQGRVKKARLLRTHVRREYHQDMVDHAYRFEFTSEAKCEGYRAFFFPIRYQFESTFEWVEAG
jgi:hypothetical protein